MEISILSLVFMSIDTLPDDRHTSRVCNRSLCINHYTSIYLLIDDSYITWPITFTTAIPYAVLNHTTYQYTA